ncbi:uncharacterized protein LOC108738400 [Agrilus planipennis]|uniref:Uncharacterized protein LOC108738400 n=1 Tax=Agrilus planipennis TaxID=224129 RepID=A0A1W4WTU0_AGRPL|nr:uncharacterized protein LOC108738400 [Agrilus planipennis]
METTKFISSITKICFSLCGNKITIGLQNGEVIELDIKTKKYKTVMLLHESVSFLKYFEESDVRMVPSCTNNKDCPGPNSGTLVAAAQNGWFSVYRNNKVMCLVQPPSPSDLKQVPIFPIVSCFYIKKAGKLLSIAKNRTIKTWNLQDASYVVLIGEKTLRDNEKQHNVVNVSLSDDESLLAITMSDNTFDIYTLNVQNCSYVTSEYKQGGCMESTLTCCCFSHDGSFLALGHLSGSITIWSVELKEVLYSLDAHKREIYYLQFSPSPMFILVSVADQIIWWNLMNVPKEMYRGSHIQIGDEKLKSR